MPNWDGTGPFGNPNWACRRGCAGRGCGFGRRGFRQGAWAGGAQVELEKEEQIKILEAQLNAVGEESALIGKRLAELRKKPAKKE